MKFGYAWTFVNKPPSEAPAPPPGKTSPGITDPPAAAELGRLKPTGGFWLLGRLQNLVRTS